MDGRAERGSGSRHNALVKAGPNGSPADDTAIRSIGDLPTSRRYIDNIGSYSTNEVAINWNALLVWVAAYLDEQFNGGS